MVELNNGKEILRADDLYHVYETEAGTTSSSPENGFIRFPRL